jgi:ankyrin repeat protein
MWVCHGQRALTLFELQEALMVRQSHSMLERRYSASREAIVDSCHGLIYVERETNLVRFSHYSIQEFLVENSSALFPDPHTTISRMCMTYLMFDDFEAAPFSDGDSIQICMSTYKFLGYAAMFWGDHVRQSETRVYMWDQLDRLFRHPNAISLANQVMNFTRGRLEEYWTAEECDSISPLHAAARYGLCDIIAILLEKDRTQVNVQTSIGITPLLRACQNGHLNTVRMLLQRSADPYIENSYGNALHCAAEGGRVDIVRELLSRGMDPNVQSCRGHSALCCTIDHDDAACFEVLVGGGARIIASCESFCCEPLLHMAIRHRADNIVALIIRKQWMDPNTRNMVGQTALHIAALFDLSDGRATLLLLLHAHADVDAPDCDGMTPMQYADTEDTIRILHSWKANTTRHDF